MAAYDEFRAGFPQPRYDAGVQLLPDSVTFNGKSTSWTSRSPEFVTTGSTAP